MKIFLLKLAKKLHFINSKTFKEKYHIELIKASKLFDEQYYMSQIVDTKNSIQNYISHYINIGWKQNYNPSILFNGNTYLEENNDVKKAQICPLVHYLAHGIKEGRLFRNIDNRIMVAPEFLSLSEKIKYFFTYPIAIREEYLHLKSNYLIEKRNNK